MSPAENDAAMMTGGDEGEGKEREEAYEWTMKVVITGGGGFLGQALAREILSDDGRGRRLRSSSSSSGGSSTTTDNKKAKVVEIVLADIVEPTECLFGDDYDLLSRLASSNGVTLRFAVGDVSDADYCRSIVGRPARREEAGGGGGGGGGRDGGGRGGGDGDDFVGLSVFHLGAVMSGAPPDVALRVNLHGTMNMLEATRAWQEEASSISSSHSPSSASSSSSRPTFVFSSAGATLGSGHPADWVSSRDTISDATRASPHTTYGTTKACAELLLSDYSRRGFLDGRGVRLPTVVVRAGAPNAAVTSCFSSVVRVPLSGADATMPVGRDAPHAVTGCRAAIAGMLAVHDACPTVVDRLLGYDRTVFLPTRAVTLGELADATARVLTRGSGSRLGRVSYDVDETISGIVGSFPTKVDSRRALALGAPPTPTVDDLVREYCEDFGGALAEGIALRPREGGVEEPPPPPPPPPRHDQIGPDVDRVVALVTGGGSGIGRAVAILLARGGWGGVDGRGNGVDGRPLRVGLVLAGRRPGPLEETKKLCEGGSSGPGGVEIDVLTMPTDVTNEDDVRRLADIVTSHFARVDLLFNNAGINIAPSSVEDIDSDDFMRVIDTNVTSCWRMAKAVMRIMKTHTPPRHGGRIINNGSVSAHAPRPGSAPYTASKHAVLGLTKCIALDGRKWNIACGQVDFGNVSSDMTRAVGGSAYSMGTGMPQADGTVAPEPCFAVEDAARAVFTMASLPLEANVLNMTVMASHMPYVGRG